ncbi:Glycerophosphodiester phosphodiesterase GDPD1, chloroplastic-like protein [Drosera capensis]
MVLFPAGFCAKLVGFDSRLCVISGGSACRVLVLSMVVSHCLYMYYAPLLLTCRKLFVRDEGWLSQSFSMTTTSFHRKMVLSVRRETDLTLSEFLAYGPQGDSASGKPLLRKTNGKIMDWKVESVEHHCTLLEAFEKTRPTRKLGFNIELKFHDNIPKTILSYFQPDAALLVRKLQDKCPILFLTNRGNERYYDVRRNTLDEALKLSLEGGLQGIVSEFNEIFRDPEAVRPIKEAGLELLTYGQLNNVPEAVYVQHLMGVDGVIADLVEEITTAVKSLIEPAAKDDALCHGWAKMVRLTLEEW